LNLRKLLIVEIVIVVVGVLAVLILVEVSPYLISAAPTSQINVYNQKEFASTTLVLKRGDSGIVRFNYSTYDPAILVLDLEFEKWTNVGDLSVFINGDPITTINAPPGNTQLSLTVLSFSGRDWVKSPSINTNTYGNVITFVSELTSGYAGTLNCRISIRGSR
jgi:hypothetical protein